MRTNGGFSGTHCLKGMTEKELSGKWLVLQCLALSPEPCSW